jgi:hypothetical protein
MTLPRSAGDVLSDHVVFELESIDRMYLNLYVPQLQRVEGVLGFIHGHLGRPIASTSVIAPMSRDFTARLAGEQAAQLGWGWRWPVVPPAATAAAGGDGQRRWRDAHLVV